MDISIINFGAALWLGILTSISPCPLSTNIAAISYVGRRVVKTRWVLLSGLLYTAGRSLAYLAVGILVTKGLLSIPGVSMFLQRYMNLFIGPLMLIVGVLLLPLALLIVILVKITSPGDALYKQKRMGKNGKSFVLYKFRTMKAENQGPLWTAPGDKRITPLGKFLRSTHLDEMPQLWNIFRGDISFIGPRAERVELAELYSELPHYEMRHIIKPGFTGWAQLNYRASASVEEANEKLKYDIYYIKNRSLLLDILIILKTAKLLFSNPK